VFLACLSRFLRGFGVGLVFFRCDLGYFWVLVRFFGAFWDEFFDIRVFSKKKKKKKKKGFALGFEWVFWPIVTG
jgi:hypothetical protein